MCKGNNNSAMKRYIQKAHDNEYYSKKKANTSEKLQIIRQVIVFLG